MSLLAGLMVMAVSVAVACGGGSGNGNNTLPEDDKPLPLISEYGQHIVSVEDRKIIASRIDGSNDVLQYSPDRARVAHGGQDGLLVIDLLTETDTQITGDHSSYVEWSPDGSKIVYSTDNGLFVTKPSGENQVNITHNLLSLGRLQPEWSPDAQWLTYRARDGFYMAQADGSRQTRLSAKPPADSINADWVLWIDDGTQFIYYWDANTSHDPTYVGITDTDIELTDLVSLVGSSMVAQLPLSELALHRPASSFKFGYSSERGLSVFDVDSDTTTLVSTEKPPINSDGVSWGDHYALFSPDGDKIAYNTKTGFYIYDFQEYSTRRLSQGNSINFDWSPEGSHIVYEIMDGYSPGFFIADTRGSGRWRVGSISPVYRLTWSSDLWSANGRYMVYEEPAGGSVLVDASDGTQIRVSDNVTSGFAWSPHGDHFAFRDGGSLCVGKPQALRCQHVADSLDVGAARWAPDSSQVAFAGQDGIVVVDADTQEWVQFNITNVENFDWSQDSTQVAYSVYPNPMEPGILYVSDPDSNNPTPIAILETEPIASYIGWLGDDRHIIYGAQYYWDHE